MNPLNLVRDNLKSKYLTALTEAFTSAEGTEPDLTKIEQDFRQDGGTDREWSVLTYSATSPVCQP